MPKLNPNEFLCMYSPCRTAANKPGRRTATSITTKTTKNGRTQKIGTCPKCGGKMYKFA